MRAKTDNQKIRSSHFHRLSQGQDHIFVGEDANNTSECTSLSGGFTVAVTVLKISNILDLSYNCITVAKVGQGRPKSKDCGGSLTSTILQNMNVLGQVIGILEPENQNVRSRRFDTFCEGLGQ